MSYIQVVAQSDLQHISMVITQKIIHVILNIMISR